MELNAPCSASHPPDIKLITNLLSLPPTQGSHLLPSNQLKGNQIVNLNFLTKNQENKCGSSKNCTRHKKAKAVKGKNYSLRKAILF